MQPKLIFATYSYRDVEYTFDALGNINFCMLDDCPCGQYIDGLDLLRDQTYEIDAHAEAKSQIDCMYEYNEDYNLWRKNDSSRNVNLFK